MASTVEAVAIGDWRDCVPWPSDCSGYPPRLMHPEDAVPARTTAMRDFYPAAARLERAIANAEVGPCR